jgi:hypothetical protein
VAFQLTEALDVLRAGVRALLKEAFILVAVIFFCLLAIVILFTVWYIAMNLFDMLLRR